MPAVVRRERKHRVGWSRKATYINKRPKLGRYTACDATGFDITSDDWLQGHTDLARMALPSIAFLSFISRGPASRSRID
jgi:hypothetical protein